MISIHHSYLISRVPNHFIFYSQINSRRHRCSPANGLLTMRFHTSRTEVLEKIKTSLRNKNRVPARNIFCASAASGTSTIPLARSQIFSCYTTRYKLIFSHITVKLFKNMATDYNCLSVYNGKQPDLASFTASKYCRWGGVQAQFILRSFPPACYT